MRILLATLGSSGDINPFVRESCRACAARVDSARSLDLACGEIEGIRGK